MSQHDWTAPPPSDPPKAPLFEWKVASDRYDGPCVFEVPPVTPGVRSARIRLVAKCESKFDADLIVSLYEKHRRERG